MGMRICAFIGDMYRDYSTVIIKTLQKRALEVGHQIDIFGNCSVPSENPLHAEGLKSILSIPPLSAYDGIILCSDTLHHAGLNKELLDNLHATPDLPPVVSIRSEEPGFCNILPDNRGIMYEISQYVIKKCGSGDIGFVTGRSDLWDSSERQIGFENAMRSAGYTVEPDMIFHGNYWFDQGPEIVDFFLRDDGTLPKAIICSNDYEALGVSDELIARGFRIPQDIMITGIDNIDLATSHSPSITTSEISATALATSAIETLEKIHEGGEADLNVAVPGRIYTRESTGDVPSERDIREAYNRIELIQRKYYDKTRNFVLRSSDFEDALNYNDSLKLALNCIRTLGLFKKCYICKYAENTREVCGYFNEDGENVVTGCSYDSGKLLPEEFDAKITGIRICLPVYYKNEVYGYTVMELDPEIQGFVDEQLEFILMLFGQTINRLQLYKRIFEFGDVMELYVRDAMTGLYNRRGFDNNISALFRNGTFGKYKIAVASIDMDGLKTINDEYGHAAGDEAIKEVARCITSSLHANEFAARMGGDEFEAVLVYTDPERTSRFIKSLRTAISDANEKIKTDYTLSASVGICEVTEWNALMECMNKADKMMYLEKRSHKNDLHPVYTF